MRRIAGPDLSCVFSWHCCTLTHKAFGWYSWKAVSCVQGFSRVAPYLSQVLRYRVRMTEQFTVDEPFDFLIATFGRAKLVRTSNGGVELRGGTLSDLLEAREGASLFAPEIIIAKEEKCRRS